MHVWLVVIYLGVAFASIDPLPDGLLITKASNLRVQTAEWTILVVIDRPTLDPKLQPNIEIMMDSVQQASRDKLITLVQSKSWSGRLHFLQTYLRDSEVSELSQSASSSRPKRGWFNFVGAIGHTLFGLATDDSIEQCRRAIDDTRSQQRNVVHHVNKLTTVLNRTHAAVAWNRHQINKVSTVITNVLVPRLNHLVRALNHTNRKLLNWNEHCGLNELFQLWNM